MRFASVFWLPGDRDLCLFVELEGGNIFLEAGDLANNEKVKLKRQAHVVKL